MGVASFIQKRLDKIATASAERMADVMIFTSVAGWIASSGAQLLGIAANKNYKKEQKHFLYRQEGADALANIGLFFLITSSCKNIAAKLVSTGKLAPKAVINFMKEKNLIQKRGQYDFDITKTTGFKDIRQEYSSFNCFATSTAALGGGILSSNIITPIVRNEIASKQQNLYLSQSTKPTDKTVFAYRHNTFEDFKKEALGLHQNKTRPNNNTLHSTFDDYKKAIFEI